MRSTSVQTIRCRSLFGYIKRMCRLLSGLGGWRYVPVERACEDEERAVMFVREVALWQLCLPLKIIVCPRLTARKKRDSTCPCLSGSQNRPESYLYVESSF